MEGPSLIIATEEFAPFLGRKVSCVYGSANLPSLKGLTLESVSSWGKHFLLGFTGLTLRVHFLLSGSYRINQRRENREPKLELKIGKDRIYFYSCSIRILEKPEVYDWSVDVMSSSWDPKKALKAISLDRDEMVADLLMSQKIFAGIGNIIKNEVLYNLRIHPETRIRDLGAKEKIALVKEAHDYSWQFLEWKKKGELKRNLKIFRRRQCQRCLAPIVREVTGRLKRVSWYCELCQQPVQTIDSNFLIEHFLKPKARSKKLRKKSLRPQQGDKVKP